VVASRKIDKTLSGTGCGTGIGMDIFNGSNVKAHQHTSSAAHEQETAIGKSVAGNTTKIHRAVDADGLPIHFSITGEEVHDCKEAPELVAKLPWLITW
jgi:hypothetical protein